MFRVWFVERRLYCRRYFLRPFRSPLLFILFATNRILQYITFLSLCKLFATIFFDTLCCNGEFSVESLDIE